MCIRNREEERTEQSMYIIKAIVWPLYFYF